MAETEARRRDWFAPLMTLATVVVAVWSLYYSGVQADVARKTFEMTVNEAHAGLQKDLADLQKQLATAATDKNLADLLGRLAEQQAKLAEYQKQAAGGASGSLADLQKQMADLQTALAQLKKEQDRKDQEIASLRASVTASSAPHLSTSLLAGPAPMPLTSLSRDYPFLTGKVGMPTNWKPNFTPVRRAVDESPRGWSQAILSAIETIFTKYPVPSGYFALVAMAALSKLFARK